MFYTNVALMYTGLIASISKPSHLDVNRATITIQKYAMAS